MVEHEKIRRLTVRFNPIVLGSLEVIALQSKCRILSQEVEESGYVWVLGIVSSNASLILDFLHTIKDVYLEIEISAEELVSLVTNPIHLRQIEAECRSLFKNNTISNKLAHLVGEEFSRNVIEIILNAKSKNELFQNIRTYFENGSEKRGSDIGYEYINHFNDNSLKNAQVIIKNIILFNYN